MLLLILPVTALTILAVYRVVTNEKAMPAIKGPSNAQLTPVGDGWEGHTHGFSVRANPDGRRVELRVQAPEVPLTALRVAEGEWAGATVDAKWLHLPAKKHPLTMPMQRHQGHSRHLEIHKGEVCLRVGSTGQVEAALGHLGALLEALDAPCRGLREELSAHFKPSGGSQTSTAGGIPLGGGRWRGRSLHVHVDQTRLVLTLEHHAALPADLRLGKSVHGPHKVGNPVVDLLLSAKTERPEALAALRGPAMAQALLQVLNEYPRSELHGRLLRVELPAPLQAPVLPVLESALALVQAVEASAEAQPRKG